MASNAFSMAQAFFEKNWVLRGIQEEEKLIGFAMYGFSPELNAYELCRLMIDETSQGKGYGRCALQLLLQEMKARYSCEAIYLSTSPANRKGRHLYESVGFVRTGETCGEGEDLEEIFCLHLKPTTSADCS